MRTHFLSALGVLLLGLSGGCHCQQCETTAPTSAPVSSSAVPDSGCCEESNCCAAPSRSEALQPVQKGAETAPVQD